MASITTRDGVSLYVKDWGRGRPVVLLHGWPLSADTFDDLGMAIAGAGMRAIAYDRRGFGRSDQPWGGYDYDTLATDLADVIERDGRPRRGPVGFSMGGGEVVRYLARFRDHTVTQAVLIGSVVPYMLQTPDNPKGVPQAVFDQMAQGIADDRAKFWAGFFPQFYGTGLLRQPVSHEVIEWSRQVAMQASLKATLACAAGLRHHRLPARSEGGHGADADHPRHGRRDRPHRRVEPSGRRRHRRQRAEGVRGRPARAAGVAPDRDPRRRPRVPALRRLSRRGTGRCRSASPVCPRSRRTCRRRRDIPDLVCLSHVRWGSVFQRPQHLMTRYARNRRVFFVEEPIFDDTLETRITVEEHDGVHVVVPHLPRAFGETESIPAQRAALEQLFARERIDRYVLWYDTPLALRFSSHLTPVGVAYDCIDELSTFEGAPADLPALERELMRRAGVVFAAGQSLYEARKAQHPNIHAVPAAWTSRISPRPAGTDRIRPTRYRSRVRGSGPSACSTTNWTSRCCRGWPMRVPTGSW